MLRYYHSYAEQARNLTISRARIAKVGLVALSVFMMGIRTKVVRV